MVDYVTTDPNLANPHLNGPPTLADTFAHYYDVQAYPTLTPLAIEADVIEDHPTLQEQEAVVAEQEEQEKAREEDEHADRGYNDSSDTARGTGRVKRGSESNR